MIQDVSLLQTFQAVSEQRSFSGAARRLGLGLPQVSKKVQKLESLLGTRLFHRTTRSVALTQDGLALQPKLSQLLDDLQELSQHFEGGKRLAGVLKITCITSVAHKQLSQTLVGFRKQYPQIQIDLDINDGVVDLLDTQTDVAIRVEGPHLADYVFKRLVPNRLIFVASPAYLKAHGTPQKLRDLDKHTFLALKVYGPCRILGTSRTVADLLKDTPLTCQSGMMLTTLGLAGAGIALRSVWDVQQHIERRELVQVLPQVRIEDFGVLNAVVPHRRLVSAKVRAFLDYLEKDAQRWPR